MIQTLSWLLSLNFIFLICEMDMITYFKASCSEWGKRALLKFVNFPCSFFPKYRYTQVLTLKSFLFLVLQSTVFPFSLASLNKSVRRQIRCFLPIYRNLSLENIMICMWSQNLNYLFRFSWLWSTCLVIKSHRQSAVVDAIYPFIILLLLT